MQDANAHRVMAVISFEKSEIMPPGIPALRLLMGAPAAWKKSVELASTDTERFASLTTAAEINVRLLNPGEALEFVNEALKLRRPDQQVAWALMTRAQCHWALGQFDDFVRDFEASMTQWPSDSIAGFEELIKVLYNTGKPELVIEKVDKWGSVRLAITTNRLLNQIYQRAAHTTGNTSKMIDTYEDLIRNLDPLKLAAPTRYQLALAYRRSIGNPIKAKTLLYEVLDGETCLHPATNRFAADIPHLARRELTEIIYEEFRSACQLKEKQAFLEEAESLPYRSLGQTFSNDEIQLDPDSILIARMYKKLGPLPKFYDILNQTFHTCVSCVRDGNPWNDRSALRRLCDVLVCLPGLEREAQVALTVQFFEIWSKENSMHDDTNEDDAVSPAGITNTASVLRLRPRVVAGINCDGGCARHSDEGFARWDARLYKCVICDTDWCEACHTARTSDNSSWTWTNYCNASHQYVRGAVDGWCVTEAGGMCFEGQKTIFFSEWLDELTDVKWPRAWQDFSRGG